MAAMKVHNGIVDDKENLQTDVSKAFKEGLFTDVTFITADDVRISTSKFMLASRVPFFATLLFGGFAENLENKPIQLKCCNSNVFREVLKFVCEGEVSFSAMGLQLLLDFMETCRYFCITRLVNSIINYLKILLDENKINLKESLVAFEFFEVHKFSEASDLFLSYIDKNLSCFSDLDEFGKLKVEKENRNSKEIERFMAFTKWLNTNEMSPVRRNEMLNFFDLRKFDDANLVKVVRKSNLFEEKDICDVLEERLEAQTQERERSDRELERLVKEGERLAKEGEQFRKLAQKSESVKFELECGVNGYVLQPNTRAQFEVPSEYQDHWLNKVEFSLIVPNQSGFINYTLESSQDGRVWTNIYKGSLFLGSGQDVTFQRRKIKFFGIKMTADKKGVPNPTIKRVALQMV